jgi:TRAP-type transport system periplasmic protein
MKIARTIAAAAAIALALPAMAEVKIAHDFPPNMTDAGGYVWAKAFADYLNANGLEAVGYERNALGDEAERLDQVSQGLLEVSMSDVKAAGSLDPLVYGIYLPFLFAGAEDLDRALHDGGMLERINAGTTPKGVRVLAVQLIGLPGGIFNTRKPVHTMADMADLRMRALDENQIRLYQAWGTTGTMVSWSEVPNALQTGVADGYVNPPFVPLMFGHADFIKHFTDIAMMPSARLVIASEDWYQGLSDADRAVVDEGARRATAANREWLKNRRGILEQVAAAGIAVVVPTPEAREEFRKASEALYTDGVLDADQVKLWTDAAGR